MMRAFIKRLHVVIGEFFLMIMGILMWRFPCLISKHHYKGNWFDGELCIVTCEKCGTMVFSNDELGRRFK